MQSMVLSRESISWVYTIVIPVRLLFATSSIAQTWPAPILTLSSVQPCAARAARVVLDCYDVCHLPSALLGAPWYRPTRVTRGPHRQRQACPILTTRAQFRCQSEYRTSTVLRACARIPTSQQSFWHWINSSFFFAWRPQNVLVTFRYLIYFVTSAGAGGFFSVLLNLGYPNVKGWTMLLVLTVTTEQH